MSYSVRMRSKFIGLAAAFALAFSLGAPAQSAPDGKLKETLRELDLKAAEAILKRDEKEIARYFTADSVTNNPRSSLTIGNSGVIEAARTGLIDYKSFDRKVESIQILGNTAILMGSENVVWNNGDTVQRRYTNIWMKQGKVWQIVARHANVICVK